MDYVQTRVEGFQESADPKLEKFMLNKWPGISAKNWRNQWLEAENLIKKEIWHGGAFLDTVFRLSGILSWFLWLGLGPCTLVGDGARVGKRASKGMAWDGQWETLCVTIDTLGIEIGRNWQYRISRFAATNTLAQHPHSNRWSNSFVARHSHVSLFPEWVALETVYPGGCVSCGFCGTKGVAGSWFHAVHWATPETIQMHANDFDNEKRSTTTENGEKTWRWNQILWFHQNISFGKLPHKSNEYGITHGCVRQCRLWQLKLRHQRCGWMGCWFASFRYK